MTEQKICSGKIPELLKNRLNTAGYTYDKSGIYRSGIEGYWSNLDRDENKRFLELLDTSTPREALRETHPKYEDMVFSSKREAALELLDIKPDEICADYGCMWGALAIGMAKRGNHVLAFDQTYDSLAFLNHRKKHEKIDNMILIQDDIRNVNLEGLFDCSLVNGVLEWIPEVGEIELKKFYGKRTKRESSGVSPREAQLSFLKRVYRNLRPDGRLLLAIENRYDFKQFIWKRDPHADLFLTGILPRPISNFISMQFLGRPYVNYLYSFRSLKKLLHEAGFKDVELYMAFPHYHFPELILPYNGGARFYQEYNKTGFSWKRKMATFMEEIIIRYFRAKIFAPSIIAVAKK